MSLWVICSSRVCEFRLKLQNVETGNSIPTPPSCPRCNAFLMTYCPLCGFPILGCESTKDRCSVCNCDMRQAFGRSIYPRWLTHDQLTKLTPANWLTPVIKRSDGSFYLALACLHRGQPKDDVASLSAVFWYVRASTPETIESVTVRLTRQPHYFAVLESQLRAVADFLATCLTDGSLLLGDYQFDGEHLAEIQWPALSCA